jgi:serine/threonine-protein kinase
MSGFATDELPPGTLLGEAYRLEGLLGRGGMGAVYRAMQLTMQRPVAIKLLHARLLRSPRAIEDFHREARIAGGFDHPGLVRVWDTGVDSALARPWCSMELIVGRTLTTVVQQNGPLTWAQAAPILRRVAEAVGHAHGRGVVHRDLKPGNVMLDVDGQVKVTDLGLAMDRFAGRSESSRRVLRLVGTAEWAAPEQLRNPDRAGPAADVWSIGAMGYYLLTGLEPFTGETLLDLVVSVAVDTPSLLAQLPVPARSALQACLAKDPERRPADGAAAARLFQGPAEVRSASAPQPVVSSARHLRRRLRY